MKADSPTEVLAARGLCRTVQAPTGALTILQDIDFSVQRGEAVAIIGPSGSGKSTLLGLLAGLDAPTSGEILMFGQSLGALDEDGRAALRAGRVGFVFQSFQLIPGLSALDNVCVPLELADHPSPRERAREALGRVGLAERETHRPNELSGGEQQRVALARAFAPDPELLFADEPTGNLDGPTGERVIDQLFTLRAEHGTALVLVTHDDNVASRCDRQVRMNAGSLEFAA